MTIIHKRRGFDRIAFLYDFLKYMVFGRSLEKAENHFLSKIPTFKNVLIIGGGTGAFLVELIKSNKAENIIYIDISLEMIALAQKRMYKHYPDLVSKIEFRKGSFENVGSEERFDMICTNYVLDVFTDTSLADIFKRIDINIAYGGWWYFTDFSKSNNYFQQIFINFLYKLFRLSCRIEAHKLPDFDFHFNKWSYIETDKITLLNGLITSKIYRKDVL